LKPVNPGEGLVLPGEIAGFWKAFHSGSYGIADLSPAVPYENHRQARSGEAGGRKIYCRNLAVRKAVSPVPLKQCP
jgi:hypothetical protein